MTEEANTAEANSIPLRPEKRLQPKPRGGSMAKRGYFRKIAGTPASLALAAGMLALILLGLAVLSTALQYCSFRAEAEQLQPAVASSVRLEQGADRATLT